MRLVLLALTFGGMLSAASLTAIGPSGQINYQLDSDSFTRVVASYGDAVTIATFGANGISSPLVTVVSANGSIQGNQWVDCDGDDCASGGYGSTTTWTFSQPINGFGGDFNFNGQILGSLNVGYWPLETNPDDGMHDYIWAFDGANSSTGAGFFGVTSPTAFTQVTVVTDGENGSDYQPYTMSDIWFAVQAASVPEPRNLLTMSLGITLLGAAIFVCRRRGSRP